MRGKKNQQSFSRRKFFHLAVAGGVATGLSPVMLHGGEDQEETKPSTNVSDAMKHPRTGQSMPGRYPGVVARVSHGRCVDGEKISAEAVYEMLEKGMISLTGAGNINKAWRALVKPGEIIGLKVNPVAGKSLSTSHELVQAVIRQLENAGIKTKNILIWDRREFQLHDAGFTPENYPGIRIVGTEQKDQEGSYYDKDGMLYGEKMIDKDWYYWADVDGVYDAYTLPYMVNGGRHSYFSRICTQMVDKIINIPIMKNAGSSATLALKNLAYGSVTNTGRLHAKLWAETCAEVCAFAPVRDKVVLNIVDAVRGCFDGGPGANPQFFCNYNTLLLATDPVAIDRIGYEMILKKRIEEKRQTEEAPRARLFLDLAQSLGLGTAETEKIQLRETSLA